MGSLQRHERGPDIARYELQFVRQGQLFAQPCEAPAAGSTLNRLDMVANGTPERSRQQNLSPVSHSELLSSISSQAYIWPSWSMAARRRTGPRLSPPRRKKRISPRPQLIASQC